MDKRFFLALTLSLLVLVSWQALVKKSQQPVTKEVTTIQPIEKASAFPSAPVIPEPEKQADAVTFQYHRDNLEITFVESLAAIKEVKFPAYQDYILSLKYGFFSGDKSLEFKRISSSLPNEIAFEYSDQAKRITKKFIFSNINYEIWLEQKVENKSSANLKINPLLILGTLEFSPKMESRFQDVTFSAKDKVQHLNAQKNFQAQGVKYLGLRDRYFCAIIEPVSEGFVGFVSKVNSAYSEAGLNLPELIIAPGKQIEQKFHIYLGPQELQSINRIEPAWSAVINYGTFDIISQVLLQLLSFFYKLMHNWGWAIILLSLAIYLLLFPLSLKQTHSMKEMQALQPQIEELRQMYKDNAQRLNKEIMELYRKHKVNPFGGCLPLLLQFPIFIALYQALMRTIALRGARFLWIKDLSQPDRLFMLPFNLPVLGNEINILPILMTIGMFIQQKISSPAVGSGSAAEQQKIMLILMPLLFGFIFYHMPAGLVLYWFVNSALTLAYQFRITHAKQKC